MAQDRKKKLSQGSFINFFSIHIFLWLATRLEWVNIGFVEVEDEKKTERATKSLSGPWHVSIAGNDLSWTIFHGFSAWNK